MGARATHRAACLTAWGPAALLREGVGCCCALRLQPLYLLQAVLVQLQQVADLHRGMGETSVKAGIGEYKVNNSHSKGRWLSATVACVV